LKFFILYIKNKTKNDEETMLNELYELLNKAYDNKDLLSKQKYKEAVLETIDLLDKGKLRVAFKKDGKWQVNEPAKKAVLLYFAITAMHEEHVGSFEFYDKIPLKTHYKSAGVRVVPPGVARYGSFMAKNVVLMPGYVNIGAYVDEGTMIDTHANVGSCAQIGKNVHLAGAVRIGGVLEPPQGKPVIIEDNVFLGSAVSVMEGVFVGENAILGSGVSLTASTRIIDVTEKEPKTYKGQVPANSVVIPGSYEKEFPAGKYQVKCALIIGKRSESQDKKVSLNDALRDFNVSV
jgi:2,3,4,5-tetrahydropyridine-2-carboxylate N-succinyltransferase